jgi:tetratricopeptide (TPR) repeat protein
MNVLPLRIVCLFFVFFSTLSVISQTSLRATVLDQETKQPIADAKFGIADQGIGVVTNDEGKFTYRRYHHVLDEASQFEVSATGYLNLKGSINVLRKLQNKRGVIYLEKASAEVTVSKAAEKIAVFWDASAKSASRNPENEINYLLKYLTTTPAREILVVVFNETIVSKQEFKISEESIDAIQNLLSTVTYKGVSDYGLLHNIQVDELLLFAESNPTFGMFQLSQNIPVHIINSSRSTTTDEYFESLSHYTSGIYKKLSTQGTRNVTLEAGPKVTGRYVNGENPVPYALIAKKGVLKEYYTDAEGYFKVPAIDGDALTFYSLGNFSKTLKITSKTEYQVLAIPKAEQLATVNLKAKKKRSEYAFDSIFQLDIVEGRTVPVRSVHKSQFNKNAFTIGDAINGIYGAKSFYDKSTGQSFILVGGGCAKTFIDGVESRLEAISVNIVENISIYQSYSMVLPCSSRIIVTTRMHPDRIDKRLRKKGYEMLENNFYNEKVPKLETESLSTFYFPKQTITGTVRGNGTLLQGVSILRSGKLDEVATNADGAFSLQAAVGDILEVKHFGMYPKSVVVTDDREYTIELITKAEILDEVLLSKIADKPSTEYDSFDPTTRMELVNGRKYDVRMVLLKEDLNTAGLDIFEMVRMSDGKIGVDGDITSGRKIFVYKKSNIRIPLRAFVDGVEMDPMSINPLLVERVSVYLAPNWKVHSKIFITTRNNPDIRKKFLADNDIELKNNVYKEEVAALERDENQYFTSQEITGVVSVKSIPLEGVSIFKKGSLKEVFTDKEGLFKMEATPGDIIKIKHAGMYPKTVVVSDATRYEIALINKTQILNEVSVKTKKVEEEEMIMTAYGKKDKKSIGYKVESELSKFISPADISFTQVAYKIPGVIVDPISKTIFFERNFGALRVSPIMIIIDDIQVTQSALQILDPQTITNLTALKSLAATNKYGSQAFGGVLLITTLKNTFIEYEEKPDPTVKNNIYKETLPILSFDAVNADYIDHVASKRSSKIRLEKYRTIKNTYLDKVDFYVDMALYFQQIDASAAREVRNDFALLAKDNIKALRILAYLNEHAGEFMQAQKVYERVVAMDPSNPQSYRDLALIYQETGEYDKALELYVNMLGDQVPGIDFSSLTSVLSNELQRLINLHKHKLNYQRLPNDWLSVNFNIDVRMTASWSDTKAPFEFQFVNPDKRFYHWNSDKKRNKNIDKDSATEEFVIDDADPGSWLINVRYTGDVNAANIPPYLKYTIYKNFGTPMETSTIKLVKLENQIQKVTLDSFVY